MNEHCHAHYDLNDGCTRGAEPDEEQGSVLEIAEQNGQWRSDAEGTEDSLEHDKRRFSIAVEIANLSQLLVFLQ